ncbi:5-formyltetrahydrofolate cyclo-ligase [Corynebacterium sp.]|uniref:5-formyltetrahydrofolate cyclo-ligase n=1 Tax=Corynebacterium sp. TaxID=1720 RepID=UPI0026DAF711|nr:5-formyltetrahydrofolate cyclo-ligase [Corynebacterium sp.]MDO5033037.1 5-formyltetrahydrofolate cyclo-ligase [Corynebacterium sp.]
MDHDVQDIPAAKKALRAELFAARKQRTPEEREETNAAFRSGVQQLLTPSMKVAAYDPLGSEPGGSEFVEFIAGRCAEVYLPITCGEGKLEWALFEGREAMRPGAMGIAEPTGPRHDSSLLAELDMLLVPAMAISPSGARMGKGGGYYDRALQPLPTGQPPKVALVYASEILDVPAEAHDCVVDGVLTEREMRWL